VVLSGYRRELIWDNVRWSAAVSISDNGGVSPQSVPLSGTGTVVKLVPTSLSFGDQPIGTTSAAKTVTMTNAVLIFLSAWRMGRELPKAGCG
jgi:hypothetical protein